MWFCFYNPWVHIWQKIFHCLKHMKYMKAIFTLRLSCFRGKWFAITASSCWKQPWEAHFSRFSWLQCSYSFFFFLPMLVVLRQQKRQHFVMMNTTAATQANKNPITSREWYWTQVRSWRAGRRCLAPLLRITYSIQKTALSRGFIGWSCWILDNLMAFSLYLKGQCTQLNQNETNLQSSLTFAGLRNKSPKWLKIKHRFFCLMRWHGGLLR